MTRIAAAIAVRLLLTVPLSWVVYWVLMPAFFCLKFHSFAESCLSSIPILVAAATAFPVFAATFADSENPLIEIYLPVAALALVTAVAWAWKAGEFRRRHPL